MTSSSDDYIIDDPEILAKVEEYVNWKELPKRHFINHVERGRLGMNVGLPNGLKNINKYTYGTRKGMTYLVGADSGVGKTTLTDFMFILNAYEHCKKVGKKLYVFYYSFEISRHMKQLKWTSFYVFYKFGVRLPTAYIDGNIENMPVTEEHMKLIRIAFAYVEQLMSCINFIEDGMHPTAIFAQLLDEHFDKIGTIKRGPSTAHSKYGPIIGYEPNEGEEESMTLVAIDHMALLMSEQSFNTKQTMDLMSKYIVILRNLFDLTSVLVQQFNSELTTLNRDSFKRVTEASIIPQRVDFGDSTYTYRDADVVFGLISPAKFDMKSFHGYDVTKLDSTLIVLCLMKNRYGTADRLIYLFFDRITGVFYDLPHPTFMDEYYKLLKEIDTCQLNYQTSP